jgi:hypothetical protein
LLISTEKLRRARRLAADPGVDVLLNRLNTSVSPRKRRSAFGLRQDGQHFARPLALAQAERGQWHLRLRHGAEPPEVGNFRRVGEDLYVTVDKDDLAAGKPLVFLDSACKIARALAVAALRKEEAGELNMQLIQDQM